MAKFIVIDNGIMVNLINADSVEIANEVTGKLCIEYFDEYPIVLGEPYKNIDVAKE